MSHDTPREGDCPSPRPPDPVPPGHHTADLTIEAAIRDYVERGFSIIPILPGMKKPPIKWKPNQERRASLDEALGWLDRWPDLGLAVVLGPISGLFAIDIDGPEADQALRARLGDLPLAPMVLSGSGKPCRCHLYFRDPQFLTSACFKPWHPKLEFRGHRGITVLPPSLHKSGKRYTWAPGRSFADLPLPEVPAPVLAALADKARSLSPITSRTTRRPRTPVPATSLGNEAADGARPGITRATRAFLRGDFADEELWNNRMFNAACDLNGNGVPLEVALPRLLAAAQPRTDQDRAAAERTIRSAYSQERRPARVLAAEPGDHVEEDQTSGIRTVISRDGRRGKLTIPVTKIHG